MNGTSTYNSLFTRSAIIAVALLALTFSFPSTVTAEGYIPGATMGDEITHPENSPGGGAAESEATGTTPGQSLNCDGFVGSASCGILSGLLQPVVGLSYVWFLLMNFLLYVTGVLFNLALVETVFRFGPNFGNSEGLLAAWGILRDLGNIMLLFGFVFMGIATILNIHSYAMKKALPRLFIFAVLLNFSLFAAEAIIDVSNGVSSAIAMQSSAQDGCSAAPAGADARTAFEACSRQYGISGGLMSATGLSGSLNLSEYAPEIDFTKVFDLNVTLKTIMTLFGLSIFSMILVVVFVAGAIMLIIRVVVLTLIMVTAPIGFAGMAVPFLDGLAKKWWHQLINQSFFVPVFLLLTFVGLKVLSGSPLAQYAQGNNLVQAFGTGNITSAGVFITFAVASGFMVAALVVSKQLGAAGADFALKMGGKVGMGVPAMMGRRVIGGSFASAADAFRRTSWGATGPGRRFATLLDIPAKQSFDIRSGPVPILGGLDLGKPSEAASKGVKGIVDKISADQVAYQESLDGAEKSRFAKLNYQKSMLEKQKERMERSGESTRNPNKYNKLNRDLAKVTVDLANTNYARKEDLMGQLKEAEEKLTGALDKLTTLTNQKNDALKRLDSADTRGDTAAAAAIREEMRELPEQIAAAEGQKDRAYHDVSELRESLSSIRDRYAQHLESARAWWGQTNYVTDEALFKSREKIMEYARNPEKKHHDELMHALESALHGGGHGGGHAAPAGGGGGGAAAHGHTPTAPAASGGHDHH